MIHLILIGQPNPKQRARTVRNKHTGKVNSFAPDTKKHEPYMIQLLDKQPMELLEGALALKLVFYLQKPKTSKRKYPTTKPDIDNLTKAIMDMMNKVYYNDDSQIIFKVTKKLYSKKPRTELWLNKIIS